MRTKSLIVGLVMALAGCGVLPTPAHRETVTVDAGISNPAFTDLLLSILAKEGLTECRGIQPSDESLPFCTIPWWEGKVTKVDRDRAIVEVGEFPAYATDLVGHSARFRRVSDDTLRITVKGIFFYHGPLPNDDVARDLVTLLEGRL